MTTLTIQISDEQAEKLQQAHELLVVDVSKELLAALLLEGTLATSTPHSIRNEFIDATTEDEISPLLNEAIL